MPKPVKALLLILFLIAFAVRGYYRVYGIGNISHVKLYMTDVAIIVLAIAVVFYLIRLLFQKD